MKLTQGSVIGSYEVIEPIGVGGMGEVYRARDSRLRREVALKILPAAIAGDPDRIARFEREAQALAALNHPHIAHIYGVEETQSTTALVLELVDGETLAERIARGPVPMAEAVSMAQSVADAMDSAHARGIVHRDLKPANVKINTAGVLKVLDFGLAKTLSDPVVPGGDVDAPTITSASTRIGVVLGTAAYMSPEQARGLPVDRRADVWAFGCLLFEMLAGSPAFTGSTTSDILAAVLQGDPQWQKLPAGTPPALVQLLRRCLEKDQRRRFHDIADVRIMLEDAAIEPSHAAESPRHRQRAWISAALLGAAAGAAILVVVQWRRSPPPAERIAFQVTAPAGSEFPPNAEMALSPDGRHLLFVAASQQTRDLWIHSFASGTSQPLPDTRGATFPFWSADGRDVGFFAGGWLKRIDAKGATKAVNLCEVGMGNPHGATWNARGEIIFANVDGPLQRIAAGGCSSSPLTRLDGSRGQVSHIRPQLLPDGRHVIYTSVGKSTEARIVSLDDPNDDVPLGIGGVAMYSAGHLVFNTRGRLLAQAFDLDTRRLTGEPVTLVPRVAEGIGRHLTQFSVSASGVVSYGTYVPAHSRLTWFDRHGNPLGTVGDVGEYGSLSLSPDESRLAVAKVNENSTEASVWVIELPGGSRRITRGGHDWLPVWSADGQRIVFSSERDQSYSVLMQAPSDGSTEPEVLLEPGIWNWLNDWSRDGEFVVYAADSKDTAGDLWILPLTGDRTPWRFLKTPDFEGGAAFSPDGNWIAYVSVESGRPEIHVRAFPSASKLRQVSTNGGLNPVWRKDGRELFFGAPDQWLMAATLSGNHVSEVKKLFQLPSAVGLWHQYTATGDGSRILAIVPEPQAIARTISVIVNWPSLLNQK